MGSCNASDDSDNQLMEGYDSDNDQDIWDLFFPIVERKRRKHGRSLPGKRPNIDRNRHHYSRLLEKDCKASWKTIRPNSNYY